MHHYAKQYNLNDLHWEFITECWRKNVRIWLDNKTQWLIKTLLISSLPFYRFKHGAKALRPILNVAGLAGHSGGFFMGAKMDKTCEPDYCMEDKDFHHNKVDFKDRPEV